MYTIWIVGCVIGTQMWQILVLDKIIEPMSSENMFVVRPEIHCSS